MKRAPNRAGHAAGCSAASLGSRFRVPLTDKNKTRTSCNFGTKSRRAPDRTQRSNAPRERCDQRKKEVRNPISGCSYEPERKLAVQQRKKKMHTCACSLQASSGLSEKNQAFEAALQPTHSLNSVSRKSRKYTASASPAVCGQQVRAPYTYDCTKIMNHKFIIRIAKIIKSSESSFSVVSN